MHKRGYHKFPSKIFCLTVPKKFRGQPFNVSENLGYGKNLCIIGGITSFRRKFFVSQCRKIPWASLQCFRKIGVSKKIMHKRGYHKFPSKIFCLTVPKKFRGQPFNVSDKLGHGKILFIIGGITSFRRKLFVSQCRKISWATLQCFRKIGVSKNFMHNRGITSFYRKFFVSHYRKFP